MNNNRRSRLRVMRATLEQMRDEAWCIKSAEETAMERLENAFDAHPRLPEIEENVDLLEDLVDELDTTLSIINQIV